MILTIHTKPNRAAVAFVAGVINARKKTRLPILSHIRVGGNDEEVTLLGCDADCKDYCAATLEYEAGGWSEIDAPFCLPAKQLTALIKKGKHLYIENNCDHTKVESDGQWSHLPQMKGEEFPEFPKFDPTHTFNIAASTLADGLEMVQDAPSTDVDRSVLNSIQFDVDSKRLRLIATDGKRMHIIDLPHPKPELKPPTMGQRKLITSDDAAPTAPVPNPQSAIRNPQSKLTLRSSSLKHLHRLLKAQPAGEPITIDSNSDRLQFTGSRLLLNARQVEGKYPPVNGVIEQASHPAFTCTVDVAAWIEAIELARPYATAEGTGSSSAVNLRFLPHAIQLSAGSKERGSISNSIGCNYTGTEVRLAAFNPRYLLEALLPLRKRPDLRPVKFGYGGELDPSIITTPSTTTIIMPMRIN